ncbi:MAG: UDP-2,3-diacylglucosamine diphosphatase [Devosiaceae bacterium]|nr:UDP-2,3-diacylglucosamine diphosphatase [Devosiaceae bacterium MH13]
MEDAEPPHPDARSFRTLFLSDIHLGSRGCQAQLLLDFLRYHDADTIYLVGDIVDGWRLKKRWHWPQAHNDVVQKLLRKGRKGARIVYLPGNHDEFLRDYLGLHMGGVEIIDSAIHESADGKRYLVVHGDQYDVVVRHAKWLAFLGDWAYNFALWVNTHVNFVRRKLGFDYWSLSAWAKNKVKNAVSFIGRYEDTLTHEAGKADVDGVICGHIHHATLQQVGDVHYINTGDWVESCTAVAEREDGTFELIKWTRMSEAGLAEVREQKSRTADVAGDPAEVLAFDPRLVPKTPRPDRSAAA